MLKCAILDNIKDTTGVPFPKHGEIAKQTRGNLISMDIRFPLVRSAFNL